MDTTKSSKTIALALIVVVIVLIGIVWAFDVKSRKFTANEIAMELPNAIYNKDFKTIQKYFSDNYEVGEKGLSMISSKVRPYGPVIKVTLEAKGKILPGLTGKGLSTGPEYDRGNKDVSTWRVTTEQGEYRIGVALHDGVLVGLTFNLADGGYSTGSL